MTRATERRSGLLPAAAFVALATLTGVACGSGDSKDSKTATPAAGTATAAPPSATGSGAAVPATGGAGTTAGSAATQPTQARTANVGAVFTLTGANASYGKSQQRGSELAVNEINTANAVPGVKITLTIEDDAGDRAQGINAFNKLINANVHAILGPTLSGTAQATDPIAQEKKVPVLGVSNTAAGITDIGDYIFRDSLTEGDVVPQTVKKIVDRVKPKRVALMFANDDAFSKSGGDTMRDALKANGVEIVTEQQFSTSDKDFRAQLTAVKGANPDAIFVSALIGPATALTTQARELGLKQPIAGGNGFNSPQLIQQAGDAAEGVIVGAAWNIASSNPLSQTFIKNYKAKYNEDPDQFAAQAYAGVYILATAIQKAEALDRTAIRNSLPKIQNFDTVLGTFSFTDKRDAKHDAVVQIVKGGKFAVYE